jgi:ribosomal protein L2
VGAQNCLTCHKAGGDAEESQLVLRDPERSQGSNKDAALRHNRDAFARVAKVKEGDDYRMLVKAAGGLDHGGEDVLKSDSTGYRPTTALKLSFLWQ